MGTPSKEEWPEGYKLAGAMNFRFHQCQGVALQTIVNTISVDGMKLMKDLMIWCPEKRPTAANSLKYPYFQVGQKLGAPVMSQPAPAVFRKTSAGSTQSDSKLIIGKKNSTTAKMTQKVAPVKDDFMTESSEKQQSTKEAQPKNDAHPKNSSGPKDGSDRIINRNLTLSKSGGAGSMDAFFNSHKTTKETEKSNAEVGTLADRTNRVVSGKEKKNVAAKDIYMAKSRYIPGIVKGENGNNDAAAANNASATNNFNSSFRRQSQPPPPIKQMSANATQTRSSVQARFEYAYGYVPLFGGTMRGQSQNNNNNNRSSNNNNASPNSDSTSIPSSKISTTSGRINWAAK